MLPTIRPEQLREKTSASPRSFTIPLDGIALQTLKATVVDENLDLVSCEGCPNLVPVNLQLRLTQGSSYV